MKIKLIKYKYDKNEDHILLIANAMTETIKEGDNDK